MQPVAGLHGHRPGWQTQLYDGTRTRGRPATSDRPCTARPPAPDHRQRRPVPRQPTVYPAHAKTRTNSPAPRRPPALAAAVRCGGSCINVAVQRRAQLPTSHTLRARVRTMNDHPPQRQHTSAGAPAAMMAAGPAAEVPPAPYQSFSGSLLRTLAPLPSGRTHKTRRRLSRDPTWARLARESLYFIGRFLRRDPLNGKRETGNGKRTGTVVS
mgnify:FL=1